MYWLVYWGGRAATFRRLSRCHRRALVCVSSREPRRNESGQRVSSSSPFSELRGNVRWRNAELSLTVSGQARRRDFRGKENVGCQK